MLILYITPSFRLVQVQNDFRELAFKVLISVPVKLGGINIWNNSDLQVCELISYLISHTGLFLLNLDYF